jgi:hypothetical protein
VNNNNRTFLAARDAEILSLKKSGASNQQIADKFKITTAAVAAATNRQLARLNREGASAWPELLRMELERMDALQVQLWPLTQFRKIQMPDGTEMVVEPDVKATQMVLNIMRERIRLLGLEQVNVNVNVSTDSDNVRSSLDGATKALNHATHDPRTEALALIKLMHQAGAMSGPEMDAILRSVGLESIEDIDDEQLALPAASETPVEALQDAVEGEVVE